MEKYFIFVFIFLCFPAGFYLIYEACKSGIIFSFDELFSSDYEDWWGTPLQLLIVGGLLVIGATFFLYLWFSKYY